MGFLKIFGYVVLSLALLMGVGLYACSYVAQETLKSVANDMVSPAPQQRHSISGNKAVIHSVLVPKKAAVLEGVVLCGDVDIKAGRMAFNTAYSASSECHMGVSCRTTLRFRKDIPASVDVLVTQGAGQACEKRTLDTKTMPLTTIGYESKISISGALKDFFAQFPDNSGFKKAPASKFQGSSSWSFNGDVGVTLDYKENVSSDTFLYRGQEVQVVYALEGN